MNAGAMDCKVRRNPAVQRCGYVGPYAVFDITGNHFRTFTVIHHKRQKLCIREVCAPAEYVQGNKAQKRLKTRTPWASTSRPMPKPVEFMSQPLHVLGSDVEHEFADRFEPLGPLIEDCELRHQFLPNSDPAQVLRFLMQQPAKVAISMTVFSLPAFACAHTTAIDKPIFPLASL